MKILNLPARTKRGAMMLSSPFPRFVLSPLSTLLALLVIDQATRYEWFTVSLALPVGALSLCLFWSGLRANILSAAFITAYALWHSDYDVSRSLQIILTVWPVAIWGGLLKRWLIEAAVEAERQRLKAAENQAKADRYDELNGNIERLKRAMDRLYDLVQGWPVLEDGQKREIVRQVKNDLANLATATAGWHQIAQDKKAFLADKQEAKDTDD